MNGYPPKIVFGVIRKFLISVFEPKPKPLTVDKLKMYVKFPFLSNHCCNFIQKQLGDILRIKFPYIDFWFIFVNNMTFQNFLSHKERLPKDLKSGLVY